MSQSDAPDTERVAVTARVPAYQKEAWAAEAERLDMSQSEYLRTMVQAGRRDLGIAEAFGAPPGVEERDANSAAEETSPEPTSEGTAPRGETLEERLLDVLSRESVMSFEELVEAVADDIEARVDERMGDLQSRGRVRYSGRDGGYVLVE